MARNVPLENKVFGSEIRRYTIDRGNILQAVDDRKMLQYNDNSFGPSIKRSAVEFDEPYQPVLKKEKIQSVCSVSDKVLLTGRSLPDYKSSNVCESVRLTSIKSLQSENQDSNFNMSDIIQEPVCIPNDPKRCGSSTDSQIDAKSTSSSDVSSFVKKAPYTCDFCKNVFPTKQKLKIHLESHDSSKRYQCTAPDCGRSFTSQKYLNNHKADHFCRGLDCTLCEFSGKNKIDIKSHFKQCHLRDIEQNVFTAEWNDMKDILERNLHEIMVGQQVRSPINCNLFETITTLGNGEQFSPDGTNSTMSLPPFREGNSMSGNGAGNTISPHPPLSAGANSVSPSINPSSTTFQNPPPDILEPQFPPIIEPPQEFISSRRFDPSLKNGSSPIDVPNYPSAPHSYLLQTQNNVGDNLETQSCLAPDFPSIFNLHKCMCRRPNGNTNTWIHQMSQESQSRQFQATSSNPDSQPSQVPVPYDCNTNIVRQQMINTGMSCQRDRSFNYSQQVMQENSYQRVHPISNQYQCSFYQGYYHQEYYPRQTRLHQSSCCQQVPEEHKLTCAQSHVQQHPQSMRPVEETSPPHQTTAPRPQPQRFYNAGSQQQQLAVDQNYGANWLSNTEYYHIYSNVQSGDSQSTISTAAPGPQLNPIDY